MSRRETMERNCQLNRQQRPALRREAQLVIAPDDHTTLKSEASVWLADGAAVNRTDSSAVCASGASGNAGRTSRSSQMCPPLRSEEPIIQPFTPVRWKLQNRESDIRLLTQLVAWHYSLQEWHARRR